MDGKMVEKRTGRGRKGGDWETKDVCGSVLSYGSRQKTGWELFGRKEEGSLLCLSHRGYTVVALWEMVGGSLERTHDDKGKQSRREKKVARPDKLANSFEKNLRVAEANSKFGPDCFWPKVENSKHVQYMSEWNGNSNKKVSCRVECECVFERERAELRHWDKISVRARMDLLLLYCTVLFCSVVYTLSALSTGCCTVYQLSESGLFSGLRGGPPTTKYSVPHKLCVLCTVRTHRCCTRSIYHVCRVLLLNVQAGLLHVCVCVCVGNGYDCLGWSRKRIASNNKNDKSVKYNQTN